MGSFFFSPALHFSPRELRLRTAAVRRYWSHQQNNTRKRQTYGLRCGDGWHGWWNCGRSAKKNTETHKKKNHSGISIKRECATRGAIDVTRPLAEAPDRLFPRLLPRESPTKYLTFTISALCWLGGETGHTDTRPSPLKHYCSGDSIRTGDSTSKPPIRYCFASIRRHAPALMVVEGGNVWSSAVPLSLIPIPAVSSLSGCGFLL